MWLSESKFIRAIEAMQEDLDAWLLEYNTRRMHQGKHCLGSTPMECFTAKQKLAQETMIGQYTHFTIHHMVCHYYIRM